jgi:hypothetical protein
MRDVAEAFFETAIEKAVYRKMNPKIVAEVFLGMFAVAGLSQNTIMEPNASASKCRKWLKDSRIFF